MNLIFKNQLLLLVMVILTLSSYGSAQMSRSVQTDSATQTNLSCDKMIAARLDRATKIASSPPKRLYRPFDLKLISPTLANLLKDVGDSELLAYRFKGPRKSALIMITSRAGRQLSQDSIQDWFIQVDEKAVRFESVATNPNLVFWDDEGRLTFLSLLYSNGVSLDASSNLVSFDLRRLRLPDSGVLELIEEEKNVPCVLTIAKPR